MKITKIILLLILLQIFFNFCDEKPTESETTGSISGKATDYSTGNALSGVTIATNPVTSSIQTGSDGSYRLTDLEPGQYSVYATKNEYHDNSVIVNVNAGKNSTADISMTPKSPELSLSTYSVNFGTTSTYMIVNLTNSGIETLNWTISENINWLTVTPISGSTTTETDQINLTASRTGLSYGNYIGQVTFNSNGGNVTLEVILTVQNPSAPQLSVLTTLLDFGQSDVSKPVTIYNTGTGDLTWNISKDSNWINVTPVSGTTSSSGQSQVTVDVQRSNLSTGSYEGKITITSNGGNIDIVVKMEVPDQPTLSLSTLQLDFGTDLSQLSFEIDNSGSGSLDWSLSINQTWITASPTSGTNLSLINVNVDRTGLSPGLYSGEVEITSNGGSGQVEILMQVPADDPPTAVTLGNPTEITLNSMKVAWSRNNDSDFAAYMLYRDLSPAVTQNSTLLATITDRETRNFEDTGLSSNTTYYYRVFVMDQIQQTTGSNTVSGTTQIQLGNWAVVQTISDVFDFVSISIVNQNDIYFAGNTGYVNYEGGLIYHWNGSSITAETLPTTTTNHLNFISFSNDNDGWAVGYSGEILHYDGIQWSEYSDPLISGSLISVTALSDSNVWIGGSGGTLYHFDGSQWIQTVINATSIYELCFISPDEGYLLDSWGKVFKYNGIGWSFQIDLVVTGQYAHWEKSDLNLIQNNDGWLCNNYYYYDDYLYHFDGVNWTQYQNSTYPAGGIFTLDMVSSNDVWGAGARGRIYHYNGSQWEAVSSPTSKDIYKIKMIDSTDGWAVGEDGVILRYH